MQQQYIVTLGNEKRIVSAEQTFATCDELVKLAGGGVPKVTPVASNDMQPRGAIPAPAAQPAPHALGDGSTAPIVIAPPAGRVPRVSRQEGGISEEGRARSLADKAAAEANGFAPKQTVYARGSRVIDVGVENARTSRLEWSAMDRTVDSCVAFERRIVDENRRDLDMPLGELRMRSDGAFVRTEGDVHRLVGFPSVVGFGGLLTRSGIGGREYLERCTPRLRATNVNHWLAGDDGAQAQRGDAKLRLRGPEDKPEVFGVVGPKYATFDSDRVAAAVRRSLNTLGYADGARGGVVYDGVRTRIEALFHSDVQPENYVAGEFFKAGVTVRTRDDGSGSIVVSAVVWQNLCLNLIILDEASQEVARIRHVGSVEALAERFDDEFAAALGKIDHFVRAWNLATHENVLSAADEELMSRPAREVLAAAFNGCIERELVPVRGKRPEVVRQLLSMYDRDVSSATRSSLVDGRPDPARGVTRAAVVNAFTRWAHEVNTDPWLEDEVQAAAGRLLLDQKRRALPFEAITI